MRCLHHPCCLTPSLCTVLVGRLPALPASPLLHHAGAVHSAGSSSARNAPVWAQQGQSLRCPAGSAAMALRRQAQALRRGLHQARRQGRRGWRTAGSRLAASRSLIRICQPLPRQGPSRRAETGCLRAQLPLASAGTHNVVQPHGRMDSKGLFWAHPARRCWSAAHEHTASPEQRVDLSARSSCPVSQVQAWHQLED